MKFLCNKRYAYWYDRIALKLIMRVIPEIIKTKENVQDNKNM